MLKQLGVLSLSFTCIMIFLMKSVYVKKKQKQKTNSMMNKSSSLKFQIYITSGNHC